MPQTDVLDNAFFDAATFSLNLGYSRQFPSVKVAHDPSVINHELGHGLTYVHINMRNHSQGANKVEDFIAILTITLTMRPAH